MPQPSSGKPRVLLFVVAYRAEATLARVLERIPRSLFDECDCEVLVVDDASTDRTLAIGCEYRSAHPEIRVTALRNEHNQGYGGNQKVGYAYAIQRDFDLVAMIHGDGQYAPEELPSLLGPLREGRADAVFGSRMMTPGAARRGGMPLYKLLGNRVLSRFQNAVLGTSMTEFHSGYRVYSVAALRRIPFRLNSNDFHFDTEIIIQLLDLGARIVEVAIPTYYGNEICRVNGLAYAKNVVLATLRYSAHRAGILYQRRYDTRAAEGSERYDLKLGYPSSHSYALERVPAGASVIDIGGGTGDLALELHRRGCHVTLVSRDPSALLPTAIEVHRQDLNDPPGFDVRAHDVILLLDVIEHVADPELFLERLRHQFDYRPRTLILTTPNVAFLLTRAGLLAGQFNYGRAGILDRTHTRLFTFRSILQSLGDCGFRVRQVRGVPAPFRKALGDVALARLLERLNLAGIRLSRTLFSYQVFVEAECLPDIDFVLRDTLSRRPGGSAGAAGTERGRRRPRRRRS